MIGAKTHDELLRRRLARHHARPLRGMEAGDSGWQSRRDSIPLTQPELHPASSMNPAASGTVNELPRGDDDVVDVVTDYPVLGNIPQMASSWNAPWSVKLSARGFI